jgi:hypothetical protein
MERTTFSCSRTIWNGSLLFVALKVRRDDRREPDDGASSGTRRATRFILVLYIDDFNPNLFGEAELHSKRWLKIYAEKVHSTLNVRQCHADIQERLLMTESDP